jgi:hypothetical protein
LLNNRKQEFIMANRRLFYIFFITFLFWRHIDA